MNCMLKMNSLNTLSNSPRYLSPKNTAIHRHYMEERILNKKHNPPAPDFTYTAVDNNQYPYTVWQNHPALLKGRMTVYQDKLGRICKDKKTGSPK